MADELLPYYEKELAYIRQLGAAFAEEHPKIAGRLGISSDTIEDPHVSRLIESFAYLNARIQHKLDDDFPELSDALLGVLYPHYQRPIPSMSIVQFVSDEEQLDSPFHVSAKTLLETEQFQGENCRFSTVYPVNLLPLKVMEASLTGRPFNTPGSLAVKGAGGVLHIKLQTFNDDIHIKDLAFDRLRFYLKGQPQHIHPLYEQLVGRCHNVAISRSEADTSPIFLGKQAVQAVGFEPDEAMLPYPPSSFIGYRLLTEFFAFPEKFMFVDLVGFEDLIPEDIGSELNIYIYVESSDVELEHNIGRETFAMGCTPVVNLFPHAADPIRLDHTRLEYQLVPDARRPNGYEVYSVDEVVAVRPSGEQLNYLPFYGLTHQHQDSSNHSFWIAARRPAKLGTSPRDEGTDIFLSLVDLDLSANVLEDRVLMIKTTCSNRDLPAKLPFNNEQPKLQCVNASPPCERIRCLVQPTGTIRPPLRNGARWRLLSHLNLNFLSITGGQDATTALRELMRLYDFRESAATRALIDSILSVAARPVSAPLNIDGRATMCRGIEIEVTLDDAQLAGSSAYLFAGILEHFFALYCSINSFSRLLVRRNKKEGYLKKCPPRSGERILI